MKKLITLCLFTLAMLIGTQNSIAQEKYKQLEESAKIEAQDLKKILLLDDDQTAMVFRSIYSKNRFYADKLSNKSLDPDEALALQNKVDLNFKEQMLQILSEEQFEKYSAHLASKNKPKY